MKKTIAFASDCNENFDIYTILVTGGEVKRVTTHSANETPLAFQPTKKTEKLNKEIDEQLEFAVKGLLKQIKGNPSQ